MNFSTVVTAMVSLTIPFTWGLSVIDPMLVKKLSNTTETTQRLVLTVPSPNDPAGLESFFDRNIAEDMEKYRIPGGVISVVQDGELVFAKGYGYADLEQGIHFQPETSLVRIASVTKLFTWTAVMQLVEQGKLDLNTDVNTYLTHFKIPNTFPEPVTLMDLMTHTAGFEDQNIGTGVYRKEDVPPLGVYLAQHMPARVRPPGKISAYSNYGADLAGYIVSEVADMPYEQYIQDKILAPLSMNRTTAWEPIPKNLQGDLAYNYQFADGTNVEFPTYFDIATPDGSISATATDMAHFAIAHLQNGRYGDIQILQDSTAKLMHSQAFTHHPQLPGWAYGFEELKVNGQRAIFHTGGKDGFRSILLLIPERNLGWFLAFNGLDGDRAIDEINQAFFDQYFPAKISPALQPSVQPGLSAQKVDGWYKPTTSAETTIEKLVTLITSIQLTALNDHTLEFNDKTWTAIDSSLFGEVDGQDRLALLADKQGKITYIAIGPESFKRVPWYETVDFNLKLLGSYILISISTIIGWSINFFLQRRKEGLRNGLPVAFSFARLAASFGCGLSLVFIMVLAMTLIENKSGFMFGVPPSFCFLMVIPILVAGIGAVMMVWTVMAWKNKYWSIWERVHYTVVTLSVAGFVWFTMMWNLLGFHFG